MADHKQFLNVREPNPRLKALLKNARTQEITEDQLKEQRISFAFGNAPASSLITKESVRRASGHIRLK